MRTSLSQNELNSFQTWLADVLRGAQLQGVDTFAGGLILEFYAQRSIFLVIAEKALIPFVFLMFEAPKIRLETKPLKLFLKSHFRNKRLQDLRMVAEKGRVLMLDFSVRENQLEIEAQLIPKNFNITARVKLDKKESQISFKKPKALLENYQSDAADSLIEPIDWAERCEVISRLFWQPDKPKKTGSLSLSEQWQKDLKKKEAALQAITLSQGQDEELQWIQAGQSLVGKKDWPSVWNPLFDRAQSLDSNRERCFAKAKQIRAKREGAAHRIEVLKADILRLQQQLQNGEPDLSAQRRTTPNRPRFKKEDKIRSRKLILAEPFEAYLGSSADDNMQLLKRAQPTDVWLHLKDYPSSHAFIFKPKNMKVPEEKIFQVAQWLVQETFRNKKDQAGGRYEVVFTEVKFVKALKHDQRGRVTYSSSKSIIVDAV